MISLKFSQVFASLPPEAQQNFVAKHLTGLLDLIPKEKSKKILSAVTRAQEKYKSVPKLDLRAKRKEIAKLLDELAKDAKTSFIKERSNRNEILEEIIDSLVDWLNDIWTVVYEHHVNFSLAHACLLFVTEALGQLSGSAALGGCKCLVMNFPVRVIIKDNTGKTVKRMSVLGPQNIDRVLLWIWRDLFVSLFCKGSKHEKDKIPEMLEDIESSLGIEGLERLLYGGDTEDADDEDGWSEDFSDFFDEQSCVDDDSEYDGDEYDRCRCHFHARHWPEYINRARVPLRECVERRLTRIFEATPSLRLYNTLMSISHNVFQTESQLSKKLPEIAGNTADNLVAALDINISFCDEETVASLLNSYAYLLRPRDAATLQCAVSILEESEYRSKSFAILEKELEDSMQAIYATIRSCFSHIEEESNKKELLEILKLPPKSSARKDRLEQWSEQIITSSTISPMAMAAIMMGLPMFSGPDEGDDTDLLNYVDLDQTDSDLEDLREEYQPNLKQRFDGWVQLAQGMAGGPAVLAKLYLKASDLMPWLRSFDAAAEMINRLRERPNKAHVADALTNLNSFAKVQRKKLNQAKTGANKSRATSASTSSTAIPNASSSDSPSVPAPTLSFSFGPPPVNVNGPPPPLPFPFSIVPELGGMEDVD
ncbi:hypothetical protein BYT27DRAFT_7167004 [Phlegmacium glaucopus]|nr:hypothetical protein BYT27DRAFT_7167004 [Phlegmacium glaucopus]